MNATEMNKERISVWLDGELEDADVDAMLNALSSPEGRACWHEYHRIGDTLRSDELGVSMSLGFSEKLAQRLAAEPYLLVPALENTPIPHNVRQNPSSDTLENGVPKRNYRHRMWSGVAIAAGLLVVVALPYTPLGEPDGRNTVQQPSLAGVVRASVPAPSSAQLVSNQEGAQVLLRDPQIEQYLIAHQRFSSSVYSNAAQYVRPTTLKQNGAGK